MSYSFSVPEGPKHDLAERVATAWAHEAERIAASQQHGAQPLDEITEQVVGGFAAVQALVAGVGRPEDHIAVSISGHANAGHAPTDGADESCNVSVRVVRPQPAETAAPASTTETPPTTTA